MELIKSAPAQWWVTLPTLQLNSPEVYSVDDTKKAYLDMFREKKWDPRLTYEDLKNYEQEMIFRTEDDKESKENYRKPWGMLEDLHEHGYVSCTRLQKEEYEHVEQLWEWIYVHFNHGNARHIVWQKYAFPQILQWWTTERWPVIGAQNVPVAVCEKEYFCRFDSIPEDLFSVWSNAYGIWDKDSLLVSLKEKYHYKLQQDDAESYKKFLNQWFSMTVFRIIPWEKYTYNIAS